MCVYIYIKYNLLLLYSIFLEIQAPHWKGNFSFFVHHHSNMT